MPFNRPDGLGVLGLAREVKAALGGRWSAAARARRSARRRRAAPTSISSSRTARAARATSRRSSRACRSRRRRAWLRRKLEAVGQRSINNVVDVTNLVLFEMGQPLHAFDLEPARTAPRSACAARAAGERITTLDGKERALDPEVLVIADRERPVAVAGVMGGAESEVTRRAPRRCCSSARGSIRTRVRRGARSLGLSTEASKRYERGVDPEIGPAAAARFLALLKEVSPAAPSWSRRASATRSTAAAAPSRCAPSRCTRLVGVADRRRRGARASSRRSSSRSRRGDPLRVTRADLAPRRDASRTTWSRRWRALTGYDAHSRGAARARTACAPSARRASGCCARAPRHAGARAARGDGARRWSASARRR